MCATNRRAKLRDPHERQHKRTHRHPECVAVMANAPMPGWTPDSLAEAMGLTDAPAAEPQRDTRRPTTTTPTRVCNWLIKPEPTVNGGMLGFFYVRVGKQLPDYYRATQVNRDDFCEEWLVEKETVQGYAEPYRVCFPVNGSFGKPNCTCPAGKYHRECRHCQSLTKLLGVV